MLDEKKLKRKRYKLTSKIDQSIYIDTRNLKAKSEIFLNTVDDEYN